LLKAALVAGTRKARGESPASHVYDMAQGFGLVDVDAIVAPRSPAEVYFLDETNGLATGETREIELRVRSPAVPLRVVLAYTDWPGPRLVNNLNLVLVDPRGRTRAGNVPGRGTLQADTRNNVEMVQVADPLPGTWQVRVVGSNVPQGPQDFALCLRGAIEM
jgi:hypothetical protein